MYNCLHNYLHRKVKIFIIFCSCFSHILTISNKHLNLEEKNLEFGYLWPVDQAEPKKKTSSQYITVTSCNGSIAFRQMVPKITKPRE